MQRICDASDGEERSSRPSPFERRDALSRRRQLEHLVAAVGDAERLDPACLVPGDVLLREPVTDAIDRATSPW